MELYLNEIFLGKRSYGIAAAALNYFNKSLDELELHEIAYLAGLPKGPNNYDPIKNKKVPIIVGGTGLYFNTITKGIRKIPYIDQHTRKKVRNLFNG